MGVEANANQPISLYRTLLWIAKAAKVVLFSGWTKSLAISCRNTLSGERKEPRPESFPRIVVRVCAIILQ
jgi:hypothetical protein